MSKIKIVDLSVGDWVCAISGTRETPPMRVVGLGEDWVNLMIDPEQGDPFEFKLSEIRGIPITPEILENNGFVKSDMYHYAPHDNENLSFQWYQHEHRLTLWSKADIKGRVHCRYIHQLQHALRLTNANKEIKL